jgi:chromosome segregation ATPase
LPAVSLELRHGSARPTAHEIADVGYLIGTVPGCDLRLPGANLPSVLCLIARHSGGATLRKLAPMQPVLVNGNPVSTVALADADRIAIGPVELLVHLSGPALTQSTPNAPREVHDSDKRRALEAECARRHQELDRLAEQLTHRQQQLDEQVQELETDRAIWYRRLEEMEQEARVEAGARGELVRREQALRQEREALSRQRGELEARTAPLFRQQESLAGIQRELAELRQQLYDRYQQRRDRLAAHHESIRRAARKLQVRKRQFEAEARQAQALKQADTERQANLLARTEELTKERGLMDDRCQLLEQRQRALQKELADRLADIQMRERQLAEDRAALEKSQTQHQSDLVRLDRLEAALDQRSKELETRAAEIDRRWQQLQQETTELQEQATQMDEWHSKLVAEAEQLAKQKTEQETTAGQLAQRAAALEGQQAMLAALRTRLERMREDVRREEQQLSEQRALHQALEADVQRRHKEAQDLRDAMAVEQQAREQDSRLFKERQSVMETAVARLRQVQEQSAMQEHQLGQRQAELDARALEQEQQEAMLKTRSEQLSGLQERLTADRETLKLRQSELARAEQTLATLQEQLRRRAEDLAGRQKALAEQAQRHDETVAALEVRRAELERDHQQATAQVVSSEQELDAQRVDLDSKVAQLDRTGDELAFRESTLARNFERLKAAGRAVGKGRKSVAEDRARLKSEQQKAAAELAQVRLESKVARDEAADLQRQLVELEQRGRDTAMRLTQTREQVRGQLAEVHDYSRKSREDLEAMRAQVLAEAERVREQEVGLNRNREEHRLAVAAFRQQLFEWQGQVDEMKQLLAQGESRLERRRAEVEKQVRQVDATTALLARQAEELQVQERAVAERRGEVERHLEDMRQWYRRKWRELAGVATEKAEVPTDGEGADADVGHGREEQRDILSLTGDIDPPDRQLGDLLKSLQLVDSDTLTALLVEARRQRRSLRQLLLAGGYLTLYQMALIEAGNLDGLVLGPMRVIDRLRATPTEAAYRVFDPRRNQEALLRHLSELEMQDAVRPDELRQRFAAAAAVQHPNVAATLEVLDIAGRPAVLQEWIKGLPSPDWPPLAAAPGVWYRLVSHAFLGLHTAHQAGLVHGHLNPHSIVLTPDGTLKLCGFGEPAWLAGAEGAEGDAPADLAALARLAVDWAGNPGQRKGSKSKGWPASLQSVLERMTAASYDAAGAVLEDLDRAGADVPANTAAWERFVRQVREQAADAALRLSA